MKAIARALLPFLFLLLTPLAGNAAERAIVVLDASGSMWGQIDGKPKLEIARQTLKSVLQSVSPDLELGLMAYGHREKGSCEDIELVVPPAKGTASAIAAAADSMKFLGKTPLSAAVKKAAEDLKFTEDKATVILITDGLETCQADPCAIGKELEQAGVDFTAHVVGFGLTAEEGKQVACLAENTGGKYFQASDAKSLEDALKVTVAEPAPPPPPAPEPQPAPEPAPAPEPEKPEFNLIPETVLKEGGEPVTADNLTYVVTRVKPDGSAGDYVSTAYGTWKGNLEPGDYIVEASNDYAKAEQKVKIEAGKVATPQFNLNAGTLIIKAVPAPGAELDPNAQIVADYPGGVSSVYYGDHTFVVPAGETKITVKLGEGEASEVFKIAAGETIEKDVIVGVGLAVINASYTSGGERVDSSELFVQILKAAKKLDGTRDSVANGYGSDFKYNLPAGDYVAVIRMDAATVEQPFTIAVGQRQDVNAVLNAGVLAIDAPGANEIRIFEAKQNLQGERAGVTYGYGEKFQTTLTAGDYLVVVSPKEDAAKKEKQVTVKAGERLEVKVD